MKGVILDAASLGNDIDLGPITSLLDSWDVYPSTRPAETAERVRGKTVVLSNKILLDEKTLAATDTLRYVSVMATGTNNVDLAAASNLNIQVSNAVGYATPSVVQHTISLLLALARSLPAYLQDVRDGRWQESPVFCLLDHPMQEISGKQLGIVGYGELGRGVARAAEALGMKIAISERPGQTVRENRMPFAEVLSTSDFLSLHCPLTDATAGLIGAAELAQMKKTAYLINTARGGLVDSDALINALRTGEIAGAAIDVLDQEPARPDEPLITNLSNLLVTPHNAWGAIESRQRLVMQMRENIEGFISGNPPRLVTR